MGYALKEIVLANTPYSDEQFTKVWEDIRSGRLPLLFDSDGNREEGVIPITRYDECTTSGAGSIAILAVRPAFFARMEEGVQNGRYRRFSASDPKSVSEATKKAWKEVEQELQSGMLIIEENGHYEATVPAEYSPDGIAHASVYMALRTHPAVD